MSEYTSSISSIHSPSASLRTDIRMMTLEMMRKDYKDDDNIINELTNAAETVVDFDRTWNGKYEFVRCAECNGPILGHRAEKCRKAYVGYEEALVKKFETSLRKTVTVREIIIKHINANKMAEITFKQDRELELAKAMPAKTSLMIGRTEIPKWIGQEFEVWKKEMENGMRMISLQKRLNTVM